MGPGDGNLGLGLRGCAPHHPEARARTQSVGISDRVGNRGRGHAITAAHAGMGLRGHLRPNRRQNQRSSPRPSCIRAMFCQKPASIHLRHQKYQQDTGHKALSRGTLCCAGNNIAIGGARARTRCQGKSKASNARLQKKRPQSSRKPGSSKPSET